ncbi:MAG: zinc ribbon domain-containing protein [Gammaproteobacteria bacterium]|nr:zinc ribbon domain-containing protein [Gammaproteobacteria bacterium]
MPTYDYRCAANGAVVEVSHGMSENLSTWGELCQRTGQALGDIPAHTPVERLATGGQVVKGGALRNADAPPCATGPCCGGGGCSVH